MAIQFPSGWVSRTAYQDPFFHYMGKGGKRAMMIWPRRAGKDVTAWNWTITEAMRKTGNYYYFFPLFAEGRKALWDGKDKEGRAYLDYIPILSKCKVYNKEMKLIMPPIEGGSNGSIIQIIGTDNYDALMGTNPVGCVFSEYALQDPAVWKYIRPILVENGGWAVFITTPRGPNHAKQLYDMAVKSDSWFCSRLDITQIIDNNGQRVVTDTQIQEIRDEGEDESIIQQEWYTSFLGAQQGSFYAPMMRQAMTEGRITHVPFDDKYPVFCYADIGHSDHTVIGFVQYMKDQVRWIDCLADTHQSLPYYASLINQRSRERGYQVKGFYWPHDMKVTDFGSGQTRLQRARQLGLNPSSVVAKLDLYDGIGAVRAKFPTFHFDEKNCAELISALWSYRKEYDGQMKVYKKEPVHDWSSHFCDMVRVQATAKRPAHTDFRISLTGREDDNLAIYDKDPYSRSARS